MPVFMRTNLSNEGVRETPKMNANRAGHRRVPIAAALLTSLFLLTGCQQKPVNLLYQDGVARDALSEINKMIGHPARALKVEITPLALTVQVQDPAQPGHVDEYRFEHYYLFEDRIHRVNRTGPVPVQLNLINNNLEENLFDLNDVNIAGTPVIVGEAVRRCALEEGGGVQEINIQRQLFLLPSAHNGDVQWDISVKSDREYANAYADAKGALTRFNLDGTNRAKNLNLFADSKELQNVLGMMRDLFGNSRALTRLQMERNYLWFSARDPQSPKKLMDFTANLNGVLMRDASISRLMGKTLEADICFAVDDVNWDAVPALLKQAIEKSEIPGGVIYKVALEKSTLTGEAKPLTWNIEVRDRNGDQDETGEVEFDAKGTVTRVKLPKSRRAPVNLFEPEAAKQAIADVRKKFGPHAKFMELLIEGNRVILIARNPKDPSRLRDFIYDEDHFSDFPGTDRTPFYRNFQDDWLFDLDDLDSILLSKLAALEKQTLDRLKLTNGKIERVTLSRQKNIQPENQKVLVEIRAQGDGDRSGWVNYDPEGNTVSVMTP